MVNAPLMISVSGVRGIVGASLTADEVLRWTRAFGSMCKPGPVVIGGDSRISKTMMRAATIAGLSDSGCNVIDLGVVPTPTIGLAVRHHQARGGIAITASHNPAEWNALKFYGADGLFLDESDGSALRSLVEDNRAHSVSTFEVGNYTRDDEAISRHLQRVLTIPYLNLEALRERRFHVGLDTVQGAGGELLATLLGELNCKVAGFNLEPTGHFPRNPEPLPENLSAVCAAMSAANVDIGFVVDPDADRLAVILETGVPAGEEMTLVAATNLVLSHHRGPVVANCSTTRALDDVAAQYNCPLHRSKVGEAHVARMIIEKCAVIGGEGNGGVMLPLVHTARDSAVGVALILQALLESKQPASVLFDTFPQYVMVKKRREYSDLDQLLASMKRIERQSPFGSPERLDGLRWSFGDSWVQIRASNTEPIVRVYAEARYREAAESLAERALELLP